MNALSCLTVAPALEAMARSVLPAVANFARSFSSGTAKKEHAEEAATYTYLPPGSSMREPTYGVSISDPDVHYFDQRSPSAAPFVSVGNPARLPYAKQKNTKYIYKFPSTKTTKHAISLSDPVYKTENDAKDM